MNGGFRKSKSAFICVHLQLTPGAVTAQKPLLFTRDLFRVKSIAGWLNLPPDQNTIVMIFAQNLRLNQGETAANVIVNLVDSNNQSFDVPATDVRAVPNVDLTQVLFRLPDALAAGTCKVTIKAHGQTTNTGRSELRRRSV